MIETLEHEYRVNQPAEPGPPAIPCQAGDFAGWETLIRQLSPVVWTVIRSFRLSAADSEDVYQLTWQRLVEHGHTLKQPERLRAWLVTTAKRESLKYLTRTKSVVYVADTEAFFRQQVATVPTPEEQVLAQNCDDRLRAAVRHLPKQHQALLDLLLVDPPLSYDQIAGMLAIPRGSIGPTRKRILARIRTVFEHAA